MKLYECARMKSENARENSVGKQLPKTLLLHLNGSRQANKVPSSMRKIRWFSSSCARATNQPNICSAFIHSIVSNDSVSGQWRPWSACVDTQADLGLRCPHMPENTFSHGAVKMPSFHANVLTIMNGVFQFSTFSFFYQWGVHTIILTHSSLASK